MSTFLLTLAYDGTDFHGWQTQPNVTTVQGTLEDALFSLLGVRVATTASGRTDEGVHATGQTVSFTANTTIPPERLCHALNAHLPPAVRVLHSALAPDGFNARTAAKRKTYEYRLYAGAPMPHLMRYALNVAKLPNADDMRKACKLIEGTHDFKSFYCLGSSAKTTVRTVYACEWEETRVFGTPYAIFRICGNGFLYKMVRLLVGALLRGEENFARAIEEGEPIAKIPAPPEGLFLTNVEYENFFMCE